MGQDEPPGAAGELAEVDVSAFPWLRLLGSPHQPRQPGRRLTPADREAAIVRAVRCGSGRTMNAIHAAIGGRKDVALRAIADLEDRGVLVRGPDGYEVK